MPMLPTNIGVQIVLCYEFSATEYIKALVQEQFCSMNNSKLTVNEVYLDVEAYISSIGYRHSQLSSFGTSNFFEKLRFSVYL